MESRLVTGASLATFDRELVLGLSIKTVRMWTTLPRMRIDVRNDSGKSYRMIGVGSTHQWRCVVQWFLDNKFTDELAHRRHSKHKYDALFSKKM